MNNYIFPLPFPAHLVFAIVGFVFFLFMYTRKKYIYHLLLAIAIPSTLLVYFCKDSKLMFYLLGIEELILIILIFIFIAVQKKKLNKTEKSDNQKTSAVNDKKNDDTDDDNDSSDKDSDNDFDEDDFDDED